jgi:hypothetical protein
MKILSKKDIVAIVLIIAILAGMGIYYAFGGGLKPPAIEVEPPDIEGRTKYILPATITKTLFSCTPEEFFDKSLPWYSHCEDYREHAKVYKGKLVLYLTKEQEQAMLDHYDSNIEAFEEIKGVDIADDYTSYTFTGTREDIKNIMFLYPIILDMDLLTRQLFNGKDPETISVTMNIVDIKTGKKICSAAWPYEELNINLDELPFEE